MAELPGELEDMVGDLMEKEEDLFDEMEDVSSSAADSLDKGAGWDADGRADLEQQRQGGDRQPPAQHERNRRPIGRGTPGQVERRVRRRRGGGQGRPQDAQPAHARSDRQGPDQGPQQGLGRAAPPAAARKAAKGAKGWRARCRNRPAPRAERLAGRQAALRNKAEALDLQFQVTQFPSHRSEEDDRRHGPGRARPEGRPLPERPAAAPGAGRRVRQRQAVSRRRVRGPQGHHLQPARPTFRSKSSAACKTLRPPAGKNSIANTSSGFPAATEDNSRTPKAPAKMGNGRSRKCARRGMTE